MEVQTLALLPFIALMVGGVGIYTQIYLHTHIYIMFFLGGGRVFVVMLSVPYKLLHSV